MHVLRRPDDRSSRVGNVRKIRMHLDPIQYYHDTQNGLDCYEKFNLLVRRNAKENNFKAVLDTIAAIGRTIPSWLTDVLLGYGDPLSATFR